MTVTYFSGDVPKNCEMAVVPGTDRCGMHTGRRCDVVISRNGERRQCAKTARFGTKCEKHKDRP